MWRSSGSTLNSSRRNSYPPIAKFESKKKLFSASCINNIFLSVITQRSCPHVRLERRLTCKQWASPSDSALSSQNGAFLHLQCCRPVCQSPAPFLHCSGTTELPHLWQLLSDLERAIHLLPCEDFSLRFRGGPKAICKKQSWNLKATEPNPLMCQAATRNSAIKIMNWVGDKGQPWQNPTFTGNESHLLPAMRPKLTLLQYRDWMACSKRPFTPYSQGVPNRCLCVCSCKPYHIS